MTGGSLPLEGIITKVNLQTQSIKNQFDDFEKKKQKAKLLQLNLREDNNDN